MTPANAKPLHTVFQPVIDTDTGIAIAYQARVSEPETGEPLDRQRRCYEAAIGAAVAGGLASSTALIALQMRPCGDPARQVAALFRAALLHRFPTSRLLLEIRADGHGDTQAAADLIEACVLSGIEVAIDGFAATPTAMRLIARHTPRYVKLDTALTRNLDTSMPRQMIVEGVVRLARAKGFTIIAQDVAKPAELSALYAIGIRHLQSYWIAPAVDEERLRASVGPRTEPRREPRAVRITRTRFGTAEPQTAAAPARPAAHAL